MTLATEQTTATAPVVGAPSLPVIVAVFVALAAAAALLQPLGHLPDEPAHLQYIDFLAAEKRFPRWAPDGGEAGYESQHPPLSYLMFVPARLLAGGWSPAARLLFLRAVAIGWALVWVLLVWRLAGRVFDGDAARQRLATAGVAWLPLTALYACHPNPDLVVAICATAVLQLAWEQAVGPPAVRRAVWLGVALAAGALTKLHALAAWPLALLGLALAWRRTDDRRAVARDAVVTGAVALLLAGPWYLRNLLLYDQLILKAQVHYGTGLEAVAAGRISGPALLLMTLRNTFCSTWIQPDWLPGWPAAGLDVPPGAVYLFYCLVLACLVAAAVGLRRAGLSAEARCFLWFSAALVGLVFAGQQLLFWTRDIEFNMGGRYLLSAQAGIAVGLAGGLAAWQRRWLTAGWLSLWLVMNLVGLVTIVTVLNPRYWPDWRYLTLP